MEKYFLNFGDVAIEVQQNHGPSGSRFLTFTGKAAAVDLCASAGQPLAVHVRLTPERVTK